MKIYFGNDHAAYEARTELLTWMKSQGHDVVDLGWDSPDRADYPDFAQAVARAVADDPEAIGVLICGSGVGMSLAANKTPGVRAVLAVDAWTAEMSRRHNDANVLCLRARKPPHDATNTGLIDIFVATKFEGGRHADRVAKIDRTCG